MATKKEKREKKRNKITKNRTSYITDSPLNMLSSTQPPNPPLNTPSSAPPPPSIS
ncbi:hypothetical protein [Priestia aryabhattai]|uniref:hypothetical protein n=1 Tax=Priestia aryabhattai TaxID=412384 RepID=UPI0037357DF9